MPKELQSLFMDQTSEAQEFRQNIRAYNSLFTFTSFGGHVDKELASKRKGVYTFRVQGQVYHDLPGLLPDNNRPCFFQLYFHDTVNEVRNRMKIMDDGSVCESLIRKIMTIFEENPYSKIFRTLQNISKIQNAHLHISTDIGLDQRVYNCPTTDQVAAVWVEGNSPYAPIERDIVVHAHSGHRHRIKHYFGYDPLQYPLLLPLGEIGWHRNIFKVDSKSDGVSIQSIRQYLPTSTQQILDEENGEGLDSDASKKVSCREYYCYKFEIRPERQSTLLHAGTLFQQFIVDQYIKLETTRLDFFRLKQKELRAELYQGIVDSVTVGESRGSELGQPIILTGSFIGGDRDMRCRYLDSMGLVQRFGKHDLFITMTCNPEWTEIQQELQPGQHSQDRPDLTARVFRAKLQNLKDQRFNNETFGEVVAHVHVIEFQKRGLPHAHILIILKSDYKLTSPYQYDKFVCSEIPDQTKNMELYKLIVKHMMHGPCGDMNKNNSCMVDGKCKYHYPREYCDKTIQGKDGYPIYRRKRDNTIVELRNAELDNN